ncbi:MAG: hypothetical protein LBK76_08410 [Verrucomicrobiales bacterium]|jgi:hypothetical protein|nr:hypothetical protein [Verrucomicrobiales bacterium]
MKINLAQSRRDAEFLTGNHLFFSKKTSASLRLCASIFLLCATVSGAEIKATDVDGRERVLNEANTVHVVIYSNEEVQDRTRAVNLALDEFQGLPGFRPVVVVDLRGSLAQLAKGYTRRRVARALDAEALRVTPRYRQNGNAGDPRADLCAVADFTGELSVKLGWRKPAATLRVIIFDRPGAELLRWEDLSEQEFPALRAVVKKLLSHAPQD